MKHDLLIIGGGLSGLFAACVASRQGKKVKILSYGESTLIYGDSKSRKLSIYGRCK